MTLLNLPKLRTSEDDVAQAAVSELERADGLAAPMIVAGALAEDEYSRARLAEAIDTLAIENDCESTECSRISHERETVAYRLGVAVGLRLARSVDQGAQ